MDDQELNRLLREWRAPDAPASLDARVLAHRRPWWSVLLTGTVRVPIPVGVALAVILMVMALALFRRPNPVPTPTRTTASFTLADYQPVDNPTVRIIRGSDDPR